MAILIEKPSRIEAAGTPSKLIEEFVGLVNSDSPQISIARMQSPQGWSEPGQTPEFTEYTLVLEGCLQVSLTDRVLKIKEGQALIVKAGEWVKYASPFPGGAIYISVCLPAFSPNTVNRDH